MYIMFVLYSFKWDLEFTQKKHSQHPNVFSFTRRVHTCTYFLPYDHMASLQYSCVIAYYHFYQEPALCDSPWLFHRNAQMLILLPRNKEQRMSK